MKGSTVFIPAGAHVICSDFSSLTRLRVSREALVSPAETSALVRVPVYYVFFARFGILFSVGQPSLNSSRNSFLHEGHFVVPADPGS